MITHSKPVKTIDDYIHSQHPQVQEILNLVRNVIKKCAPDAKETIKYGIPTFTLNGNLVHFAAYPHHLGFYPTPSAIKAFKSELLSYKTSKGAIQFPLDKPIPYNLITRLVEFRVRENMIRSV